MNKSETIEKMFSEMGLGDNTARLDLTDKIRFDFDFTKNQYQEMTKIIISKNTKTDKLCPTGTK